VIRDWKFEAGRLRSEDCQHVHGLLRQEAKAACPQCMTVALRRAYEAGMADERQAARTVHLDAAVDAGACSGSGGDCYVTGHPSLVRCPECAAYVRRRWDERSGA
jgi:hypothetical protein